MACGLIVPISFIDKEDKNEKKIQPKMSVKEKEDEQDLTTPIIQGAIIAESLIESIGI